MEAGAVVAEEEAEGADAGAEDRRSMRLGSHRSGSSGSNRRHNPTTINIRQTKCSRRLRILLMHKGTLATSRGCTRPSNIRSNTRLSTHNISSIRRSPRLTMVVSHISTRQTGCNTASHMVCLLHHRPRAVASTSSLCRIRKRSLRCRTAIRSTTISPGHKIGFWTN